MSNTPSKQIWLEPVLGRNRERLIKRCQAAIRSRRDDRFIYLAATRPLLDRVLDRVLDGEQVAGCRGLPIFLFDGLVKKILSLSPATHYDRTLITEDSQYFLLEQVIGALIGEGALRFMPDIALTAGCVQEMGDLIGELKRSAKRPEDFRQFLLEFGGDYRDQDLAEIYQRYQQVLDARRLMDIDDAYLLVRDMLARGQAPSWLQGVEQMFIDGFYDFTPIQDEVLRQLAVMVPEIIVNLNFDARNPSVFSPVQSTIEMFEPMGFVLVNDPPLTHKRHPLLETVARNLFNPEAEAVPTSQPVPLTIFSAPHALGEVREIARQVKRLIIEDGYRPAEIAVVVRDADRYGPTIRRVFTEAGIPCRLDDYPSLPAIPAVKAALRLLEARAGWEQIESFEALIKNDYVEPFSTVSRDAVDNALVAVGLQLGTREWLTRAERLRRAKEHAIAAFQARAADPEEVEREVRQRQREIAEIGAAVRAVQIMREYLELIPDTATIGGFITAYQRVLQAFRIERRLQERLHAAVRRGVSLADLARDLKGLHKMVEVLEDAAQISGGTAPDAPVISLSEFKALIEHRVARARLRLAAGDARGVAVLEVRQCHGLDFRAVFMAGMLQGVFPQMPRWDWMYSAGERQRLADCGLHLEDLSPLDFQKKENHFFYQCVGQATDRLLFSYPRTLGGDEETVPSTYLDDIRDLFRREEGTRVETRHVGSGDGGLRQTFSRADLAHGLVSRLWQAGSEDALVLALYRQALEQRILTPALFLRLQMEMTRQGEHFTPFDGLLQDKLIQEQLQQRFNPDRVYSAGQFNTYGICPFQFFARWVLQLDARNEASLDLRTIDRRRLIYDVLYEFLTRHARERLSPDALDRYRQELNEITQGMFTRYEDHTLPLNPQIWELEKMDIQEAVQSFLDVELDYQTKVAAQGVQPHWLELGFGVKDPQSCHSDSKAEPLQLQQGADTIKLRGRIDRVDRSSDGKLIAYQYQSSAYHSVQDMRAGIDLQIPIYILALRRLFSERPDEIVGAAYYALREGSRSKGLYREDQVHYAGVHPRSESSLSAEEWEAVLKECEAHVWRYVAGMRQGDFRVQPKTTSYCPRCDYRTVCRYEKHRIQRKIPV